MSKTNRPLFESIPVAFQLGQLRMRSDPDWLSRTPEEV
jgi:hypothetical protein